MAARLDRFLNELTAKKRVPAEALPLYRTALQSFEATLGANEPPFGQPEINRFLADRQKAGAGGRELRNLGVACQSYLAWSSPPGVAMSPAPRPLVAEPVPVAKTAPPKAISQDAALLLDGLPPPPPAPTATKPGASSSSIASSPSPEPARIVYQDAWRPDKRILWGVAGFLVLMSGCFADSVRQSRRISAFSVAVRQEAYRTTKKDPAELRDRVMGIIEHYGVKVKRPEDLRTHVNYLNPMTMNQLAPGERMAVAEAMQRQHVRAVGAVRGERLDEPPPFLFVEVAVRAKMPGIFGGKEFDFVNSVAAGGGIEIRQPLE